MTLDVKKLASSAVTEITKSLTQAAEDSLVSYHRVEYCGYRGP